MTSIIPDLKSMHPIGPLLAQECVPHHGHGPQKLHLPDDLPRPELRQMASRSGHDVGVCMASRIPAASTVPNPGEPLGAQIARAHPASGRDDEAVSGRVGDTDTPRSSPDHRVGVLVGAHATYVCQWGRLRSGRSPASGPSTSSTASTGRSMRESPESCRLHRWSTCSTSRLRPTPSPPSPRPMTNSDSTFTAEAEARMRRFLDAQPAHEHGGHHYTFAQTGLDEKALRERTSRYQDYFEVPNEPLG